MPDFARERHRSDPCPCGRPAGVRRAHGPLPARAAAALLPDPRPGAGRRGRSTGDTAFRVECIGGIRRALDAALLAVSDRHQPVPEHAARDSGRRPATATGVPSSSPEPTRYGEVLWLEPY